MAIIDYSTDVGKVRTRVGDWSDLPYLPDSVYSDVITENNGNLQRASVQCAQYILAQMAYQGHRKLANLEVWGKEVFDNYRTFLTMIAKDPSYNGFAPVPYDGFVEGSENSLQQFVSDWNNNYAGGTQSQLLHEQAQYNDGVVWGTL